MGVDGLLRTLKPVAIPREPSDLSGLTLGVDGYGWLHKAVVSCAEDLVLGKPTVKFLESIDRRVRLYELYGVNLYFVFDGASLPMKARVESERAAARAAARAQMVAHRARSFEYAMRAVDVTPAMAAQVCAYLRVRGIPYVVAPYEADPQLVYLEQQGIVDGILSEDSDMLVFGAKRLFTKADADGRCLEICVDQLDKSALAPISPAALGGSWKQSLRVWAILCGCDYSEGVARIGPVKAVGWVRKYKCVENLVPALQREGRAVPKDFHAQCRNAEHAFLHQRVWCPVATEMVCLDPDVPADASDEVIGPLLERSVAIRIAKGVMCPLTREQLIAPDHIKAFLQRHKRIRATPVRSMPASTDSSAEKRVEKRMARALGTSSRPTQSSPFFVRRPATSTLATPATPVSPTPATPSTPSLAIYADPAKDAPCAPRAVATPLATPSRMPAKRTPFSALTPVNAQPALFTPSESLKRPAPGKENVPDTPLKTFVAAKEAAKEATVADDDAPPKIDLTRFMYRSA